MALTRLWRPSPHYSTGRSSVRLIVLHTTEGAQDIESLANWFKNPSAKVSSHVGADNKRQGTIAEYVKRHHSAWAQGNYNSVSICIEMCTPSGAANGWSRDYWLSKQGWLLDNTAAWVAEEARAYGIPIVKLNASQAQGSGRGLCGHVDIQPRDRTDPGKGFPWDYVIAKATGGKPPASSGGGGGSSGGSQAPKFSATPYFDQKTNSRHPDVKTWQNKMRSRGWGIGADGIYGPQSEDACRKFQREKGLGVDGKVGPQTWSTTWSAPVT
jgi:N-acetyl-anhydromuramyl-L-alanine amidase AmpD